LPGALFTPPPNGEERDWFIVLEGPAKDLFIMPVRFVVFGPPKGVAVPEPWTAEFGAALAFAMVLAFAAAIEEPGTRPILARAVWLALALALRAPPMALSRVLPVMVPVAQLSPKVLPGPNVLIFISMSFDKLSSWGNYTPRGGEASFLLP
jgi:hypothetical protein